MNIGTICYATRSGLGILAKRFYDHGIINKILAIQHPHYANHFDWYKSEDLYLNSTAAQFSADIDTLLIFENAWQYWSLIKNIKGQGKRFALMPMYEYTPDPLPVEPDVILCPSALDKKHYPTGIEVTIPVEQTWHLREHALRFVHNAGHGGKDYRNGTPELLEAMQYVKSPIQLTVRMQPNERRMVDLFHQYYAKDPRVEIVMADVPDEKLYAEGDVFIFPEKFNGLSLPMQEAWASGMMVMGTDRFPMNTWLPPNPLIPSVGTTTLTIAKKVESSVINPYILAKWIDAWFMQDIMFYSWQGKQWAEKNSWAVWKPKYLELLGG